MSKVIYPVVALLALIALAYKIPPLVRDPRSPTRRALVALLACLMWAPLVNTPFVYLRFDAVTGVPNLARLIAHYGIIGFAVSVQILLLHWTVERPAPHRTWIRLLAVTTAAAAMAVFFVLAPLDVSLTSEFTARYGDAPYMAAYMLVYLGYFVIALVDILRLSWRFTGLTRAPFLRVGLRLVSYGAVFGIAYCLEKGFYVAARNAGYEPIPAQVQEQMSPLLTGPGCVLMLIGFTIPSWGPRVAACWAWVERLRTYRRLYPLWRLLYEATPEIALDPEQGHRGSVRDVEYRLVRRVVEIRDGWLALRPYFDARVARAAGSREDAVHAAVLMAAARAKARDEKPVELYTADPQGGTDITEETAQLLRIARHIRTPDVAPRPAQAQLGVAR
ncbi:MAB_1171c family putative transporter [Actinoplanes sp. NPDC049548]|uniref:MAB_1171c family putative transporter n=1 Tax=Actinoplanes sp. NPDC049548 TaxID=3155152 RepID=UPI003423CAD6